MRNSCATCGSRETCRRTFGRYFNEKSSGGTGCEHRLPFTDAGGVRRPHGSGTPGGAPKKIILPKYTEELL